MRIADQIANWLAKQGVLQAFSVTGGGSMFLNHAIGDHTDIRCSFMHHEQACAMAAEGYARITNKPAIVMLTTGPGPMNAMNGVFGAFTDSIPMIVISGQVKRETCASFQDVAGLRQLGDQEGPTIAMAKHICKFVQLIRTSEDLVTALPEAYRQAVSGRPGPVWLDIPLDIQSSTDPIDIPDVAAEAPHNSELSTITRTVLEKLAAAKRPIILGGTGVRLANAIDDFIQLAESAEIPVTTAWTHDLIPSEHPLFAGRPGTIGTRAGNFCVQNADLVLVLGSRLNIRQTSYNWDSFAKNAFIIQVDIDPLELQKPTFRPNLAIVADVKQFLVTLNSELGKTDLPKYNTWVDWCSRINKQYSVRHEHSQKVDRKLNPYLVVDHIFQQSRPNDIFVCGNASACILPFQIGQLQKQQRLFSNSGSASMGYELPAAIGAATAGLTDKRRVICFAGDGSLQMNIQELQTLKTLGLNVIIIVLNNEGYLSIKQTHENFFGKVIGANPSSGVEFPNFSSVAKAYGLDAMLVDHESDFIRLDAMLAKNGPMLIDIHVDPLQEFEPRIKSRVDENGKFVTPELDDMFPFLDPQKLQNIRQSAKDIF